MKSAASRRSDETNLTLPKLMRRISVAAIVAGLLLFGSTTGALAHDVVTGTSPADGATTPNAPEEIQITMSNTPAVIGSEVQVLDAAGTNWADGAVDVLDTVATQRVRAGAPAGNYTVKWRLVSSDSHPIEGEFGFTATAAATAATGQAVGAGPVTSVMPEPESVQKPVEDESAVPWSIFGLVAVLLGVVVAMVVVSRRRLATDD